MCFLLAFYSNYMPKTYRFCSAWNRQTDGQIPTSPMPPIHLRSRGHNSSSRPTVITKSSIITNTTTTTWNFADKTTSNIVLYTLLLGYTLQIFFIQCNRIDIQWYKILLVAVIGSANRHDEDSEYNSVDAMACSLLLHELGFTLTLSACQHVLPCFLDLVFIALVDAVATYSRHYKEPVFGDAILIVYRQQISWSTIRYGMQAFTVSIQYKQTL